jgi:hypothetical protein
MVNKGHYHLAGPRRDSQSAAMTRGISPRHPDQSRRINVFDNQREQVKIALEHILVEAQPANRFAIPPGFRNFDPRALIERIKHSDAWVDP